MMLNNLISIALSEKDKRLIIILLLVILLIILLIGTLNYLIMKQFEKEGLKLDKHISGYVKYGFVENEKDFKKVAYKKSNLIFFKQCSIPLLLLIIPPIIFFIYISIAKLSPNYIWQVYDDMFPSFGVEMTTILGGIPMWADWPYIIDGSVKFHNTLSGYVAYIFLILIIIGVILFIRAIFNKMAREKRIKVLADKLYSNQDNLKDFEKHI